MLLVYVSSTQQMEATNVFEEAVSGIDGGNARAIEIEAELNVSFGGFARLCRAA